MENQKKTMSKNKKILIAVGALLAAVLVFVGISMAFRPAGTAGDKSITFTVVLSEDESKEYEIDTDAEFLRGALEENELIEGDESEYGLFVTVVDGVKADDSKQEWWCFTKDGEMLETGVDTTPIADGENFEATLTTGW